MSLDPQRSWFRYHHLFADLLRLELRRRLPADVPALHRLAAAWLLEHGQVADAIRHTQAAGDWPDAARLLADHSFSLTLDGQAQTIEALLQAFPPGAAADDLDLALARATIDLARGRLDEGAAHLAVAESYAGKAAPGRQHRLQVALASLQLSLARRRGNLAGVLDQVNFLTAPVSGQSDDDIALDSDLRAVALMNLGIGGASPASTAGRLARPGQPADRLEAGQPGPRRAARRGPGRAGGPARPAGQHGRGP